MILEGVGGVYRLSRELDGATHVQRWDPGARVFLAIDRDRAQAPGVALGWPPGPGGLFSISAADLPSGQARQAGGGTGYVGAAYGDGSPWAAPSAGTPADTIAGLEAELAIIVSVDELQGRLDALGHEVAQLEGELQQVERLQDAKEQAALDVSSFDRLLAIPDDLDGHLQRYRAADAERQAQLSRIESDREVDRNRLEALPDLPLVADPWFWVGLALGTILLFFGMFSSLHVVTLLDIPAFGLAALRALAFVGRRQDRQAATRRLVLHLERQKKVENQWAEATAGFRQWLELAAVESADALVGLIKERSRARRALDEASKRHGEAAAQIEAEGATEAIAALRQEVARVEGELGAAVAGAYRSRSEVEAELEAWRAQAADGDTGGDFVHRPGPALGGFGDRPGGDAEAGFAQSAHGALVRLFDRASTFLGLASSDAAGWLFPRAGEFLAYLSDGSLTALELTVDGRVLPGGPATHGAGPLPGGLATSGEGLRFDGRGRPPGEAGPSLRELDLTWISLLLAFHEVQAASTGVPLILDDPFPEGLPKDRLGPLLQGVGRKVQIIHRTDDSTWAPWADAVATGRAA